MGDKIIMHPTLIKALKEAIEDRTVNQWREIAEQTRDYMISGWDGKNDGDIIHTIRESHIAFGAACAFNAAEELKAAIERADELEATFDFQWKAQMRAIEQWRATNPGNDLVMPDGAELLIWLLEKAFPAPPQDQTS